MRCSADSAKGLVNSYVAKIEMEIRAIKKNFNDMDFENADAKIEVEDIVNSMISKCRNLINELQSYRFD